MLTLSPSGLEPVTRAEPSITATAGRSREDDLRLAVDRVLEYRVARRAELEERRVVVVVPMTELISTAAAAALDGEMNDRAAGGRNAPH